MAKTKNTTISNKKPIEQYEHKDKVRVNNPPVGLVTPDTDKDEKNKTYSYDPHLDPQLVWAGKAERLSFNVDTVSLHVHERIDPRSIIEAVRKKNGSNYEQLSLFNAAGENPPLRDAIEFYKHRHNWSNRLIAGDSLLVMNSLIEKEGLAGQVQMVYFDPPYGIKYGSNFQPFVNQTALKSTDEDEDLTAEPEMLKAFRDTWELGIHSYLTYVRDRLILSKELLNNSGSIFIQISEENIHRVRLVMDEIFGEGNFIALITVKKASVMFAKKLLNSASFYLLWYAKSKENIKYRQLYTEKDLQWFADNAGSHLWIEHNKNKTVRKATPLERENIRDFLENNPDYNIFGTWSLNAQGIEKTKGYKLNGNEYFPPKGTQWKTSYPDGLDKLKTKNRLQIEGNSLRVKLYPDDYPVMAMNNLWDKIGAASKKIYVVQTSEELPKRCALMTTDPGDLVFDPTCGSGTTAIAAEQWGRRWITCDTSRVAITLAKQRLMTSLFDYYQLAHLDEGVSSGFKYETVPHITLGSIANDEPPATETLYDKPFVDNSRHRVTGPFTVEAVPSLAVRSIDDIELGVGKEVTADNSIVRSGETLRQSEWREELMRTGIRGKNKQEIKFSRVEPLSGTKWLHAEAPLIPPEGGMNEEIRTVVSFGPEYAPLEQRQVSLALEEAQLLVPKPKMVVFAAFQFDPEAAKDIDETKFPGVTLIKVQMNTDLLTDDLKKKRSSNESFWLIGSPDVKVSRVIASGLSAEAAAKAEAKQSQKTREITSSDKSRTRNDSNQLYQVEVLGFDYYNTKTGNIESGGKDKIAMWMLDTDYDGRSLFPRQVFFPMSGEKDGWSRLAKNLKAEIDEELIETYRGTVSLPFEAGEHQRIAVKIVDDRGIESLKIVGL